MSLQEDGKRVLTELGRKQAAVTGKRIAELIKGVDEKFGPCYVKVLRVSNMARAKETADIIAKYLPEFVERAEPDSLLNEGRPCHTIPSGGKVPQKIIGQVDRDHLRIEEAFQKYFYRAGFHEEQEDPHDSEDEPTGETSETTAASDPKIQHEFEIIIGHANAIRYFVCR
jgi:serine/threonine-protein phosphatase PGAM5